MPTQAKAEKIDELTDKLGRAVIAILVPVSYTHLTLPTILRV